MKRISVILLLAFGLTHVWTASKAVSRYSSVNTVDDSVQINDVVVTGSRQSIDIRQLSQTITILDRTKLTDMHRQNILPTLTEQVPGMLATSRGMMGYGVSNGAAGGMMLRGISSGAGQMMVLIDGHPQYNGIYGHSIADSYQTMMADRVEILRGPSSLLYGSNAMGGVVNIVTRGMKQDGCQTMANVAGGSYGTVEAEASNQFRKGGFYSTIAGQYGRSDNHRANMGFEQYGGYLKLGYEFSQHWNIFADADITHFNASNPGTVDVPKLENDQWITRYALNLVLENKYNNLHTAAGVPVLTSGAVSVYDNFGRHKINDGYNAEGGTPQTDLFRSKDAVAGVSVYQSLTYNWKNPTTITAGFDWQNIYGKAWYENRETGDVVTTKKRLMQSCDDTENEYAGYVQWRQELGRYVTFDAGLRLDYHTVAGTEWIPQFGLAVRPVSNGQLKFSISKGFRNPSTKEMFLYGTANSDSLYAERMWNYEVSWRQRICDNRFAYGINVFYIDADNIIQTVNNRNVNTGHLYNSGVEVEASWQINDHWSLNTNHSYLHMTNPVISAPRYKGYLGGQWHCDKWKVIVGVMQIGNMYTSIGDDETKESFTLVNATVDYQLCKQVCLWVKGDNLLAQKYEYIAGMPMPRATFMGGVSVKF